MYQSLTNFDPSQRTQSHSTGVIQQGLAILATTEVTQAGAGRIRIFNDGTRPYGEVELYVNFTYDPATGPLSIEDAKKIFRTASTVLCDATDEYFRLSKIIFTKSAGGKAQADVEVNDINKATRQDKNK